MYCLLKTREALFLAGLLSLFMYQQCLSQESGSHLIEMQTSKEISVSVGSQKLNFSGHLVPHCKITSYHEDMKRLFLFWSKAPSYHKWSPQLPDESRMKYGVVKSSY